MGAAVSIELQRPADGSDLLDLEMARGELIRLRQTLGHLAKDNGFAEVVLDGSDIIKGFSEENDYAACIHEVVHIRACLRLSTQNSKRRTRPAYTPKSFFEMEQDEEDEDEDSDSDEEQQEDGEQEDLAPKAPTMEDVPP